MARQENYKILIGKDLARAATSVATLANGEIAVVKNDMTLLVAGETIANSDYVYVVQGTAAAPRFSAKIQGANVSKWGGTQFAAAVQQVATVGALPGAAGSINLVNSTQYVLSLIFTYDKVIGSERQLVRRFYYTSDATATQQEIAQALAIAINADDYITANGLVTAVPAVGLGTNWGITITANVVSSCAANTYSTIDGYEQVTFKTVLGEGFNEGGATTLNMNTVVPLYGSGTYEHVSDLERAALGYDGITNLMRFPVPSYPLYAVCADTYDVYSLMHSDRHATANLNQDGYSPEMTLVAMENGGAGQQLAFEGEINPWLNSCPGNFAAVVL
jgi:hypothetical protein|tara:strand:- start:2032 stop:3030 length:999 start_codon:yes stop_codon:yes gene_type:complete